MADRVLTVSPNYAVEIQTSGGGEGLQDILIGKGQQLRLAGILNGISDEWNPKTDPNIPFNYGLADFAEGKARCKAAMQKSFGLTVDPNVALIGFCGRMASQKGIHLICDMIPWLMADTGNGCTGRVQLWMMGKGEVRYEEALQTAEAENKGKVCSFVGFDPKHEHLMMAGVDFLLMPSQYEPCGLPQMYAQAYGTVPIVHDTGGLTDSVSGLADEEADRDTATGFLFRGFDVNALKERTYQALDIFHKKKDLFKQLQVNGLKKNWYWPPRIDEYEKHIDWTMEASACCP